jgi:hypothetical protein
MTKRHTPITSILAHDSIKESKAEMYRRIIEGLNKLRTGGTFDEISIASNLKPQQVWKRLSEMQGLGLIFNVGTTRPGASGRSCSVWQLQSLTTIVDISELSLTNCTEKTPLQQLDLFSLTPFANLY